MRIDKELGKENVCFQAVVIFSLPGRTIEELYDCRVLKQRWNGSDDGGKSRVESGAKGSGFRTVSGTLASRSDQDGRINVLGGPVRRCSPQGASVGRKPHLARGLLYRRKRFENTCPGAARVIQFSSQFALSNRVSYRFHTRTSRFPLFPLFPFFFPTRTSFLVVSFLFSR